MQELDRERPAFGDLSTYRAGQTPRFANRPPWPDRNGHAQIEQSSERISGAQIFPKNG
jgi:hypothetical protein